MTRDNVKPNEANRTIPLLATGLSPLPELLGPTKGLGGDRAALHSTPPQCWALSLGQWGTHPVFPHHQRPGVVSSRVRAQWLVTDQPSGWGKPLPSPASASTSSAWQSFPSMAYNELCGGEARADLIFDTQGCRNYLYLDQPFSLCWNWEYQIPWTVLSLRLDGKEVQPGRVPRYFSPFLRTLSRQILISWCCSRQSAQLLTYKAVCSFKPMAFSLTTAALVLTFPASLDQIICGFRRRCSKFNVE